MPFSPGERLRGGSGGPRLRRAATGREAGEEGSRTDGGLEKRAGQFPAASLHPGGSRRGRRFCACALFTFFFSLNPVILPEALGFLFSSSVERPPRDAAAGCCPGGGGGSRRLFPPPQYSAT